MIVINVRNPSDFTYIANQSMRDRRLSAEARGVLGYLLTHSEKFEIDYDSLRAEFGKGKEWLQRVISELKKFGYLQISPKQTKAGKFNGWEWTVYGQSQEKDFSQPEDHRKPEKPKGGKTVSRFNRQSENPPLNKEITNKDEEGSSIKEDTHINARTREWIFPLKELFDAFPELVLTPGKAGLIESEVKKEDKAAWLATIKLYAANYDPSRERYLPEKVGTLLDVFKSQKKKEDNANGVGNRNNYSKSPDAGASERAEQIDAIITDSERFVRPTLE